MRPFRLLNVIFFFFTLSAHSSCLNAFFIAGIKAGGLQQYKVEDIQKSPLLPHQKDLFTAVAEASEKIRQHYETVPHPSLSKLAIFINPSHKDLNADGISQKEVNTAYLKLVKIVEVKLEESKTLEEHIYDLFYMNLSKGANPPEYLEWNTTELFALLESNETGLLDMLKDPLVRIEILASLTKYEHLLSLLAHRTEEAEAMRDLDLFLADAQSLSIFKEWLNELFRLHKIYYDAQQKVNGYIDTAPEEDMRAIIEWINHE